jgi:hypothetical protein
VASDPRRPDSINQALGGYGAGLSALAGKHQLIRALAGKLNKVKGMTIVFIAHADTETIDPPDAEPYTRYGLRLQKKSVAPYVDDSDLVGFIKLEQFSKDSKAVSTGSRVIVSYATAANISKNRYGIKDDLVFKEGENPLIERIPFLKNQLKEGNKP